MFRFEHVGIAILNRTLIIFEHLFCPDGMVVAFGILPVSRFFAYLLLYSLDVSSAKTFHFAPKFKISADFPVI